MSTFEQIVRQKQSFGEDSSDDDDEDFKEFNFTTQQHNIEDVFGLGAMDLDGKKDENVTGGNEDPWGTNAVQSDATKKEEGWAKWDEGGEDNWANFG